MSTSILRTADAWWVQTPAGAARIDTAVTTTRELLALSAPPKPVEIIGSLLPPKVKWKMFFQGQAENPRYLKDGDVVEAAIGTDDGALDLGRQRTVVRYAR